MPDDTNLAATLQRVQVLRAAGHSLRKMADMLQSEGFAPVGRAKKWNYMGVRWCLQQLPEPAAVTPAPPSTAEHAPAPDAKPSLKIEIYGPYTAPDLSLWTFLLNQIGDELTANKEHTLPLPVVYNALKVGKGSPTRRHLWEALQRLASTRVFWDGKLGQRWTSIATHLLTGRVIDDENVLVFEYTSSLVKLLRNRQQRARLYLLLESKKR